MIKFGASDYLSWFWMIPILVFFFIWAWRKKQRDLELFSSRELGSKLTPGVSRGRQKFKKCLLVFSLSLMLLALCRPQWGYRWEEVKRRGVDIMIAVDVSKSMLAQDVSPNRLERARRKIADLLHLLQGDRVGLIGFAGRAFVMTPLTLDYSAIHLFVDSLDPSLIPIPGTAVAEAIQLAIDSMTKGDGRGKALLLMSDGEDLAGDVLTLARQAGEKNIHIYTLGIGTPEGAPIPLPEGGFQKDRQGTMVLTKLDESILERIAQETQGEYARSVSGDQDLKVLYRGIREELPEAEITGGRERHSVDRYPWFLGAALLGLLIESFLSEMKKGLRGVFPVFFLFLFLGESQAFAFGTIGLIQEGEKLYQVGRYEEALQKFKKAETQYPQDPRLQYNLGNTYYQLKKYEEAQKIFGDIRSKSNANPSLREKTLYNEGNTHYREHHLEEAIQSYEEALKINPADGEARENLEFVKKELEKKKQEQKQEQQQNQGQKEQKQDQEPKQGPSKPEDSPQQNNVQKKPDNRENQPDQPQGSLNTLSPNQKLMTPEEAERYLSTVNEGKVRIFYPESKNEGQHPTDKDW